jgi:transcriptional regulator with GAF, ATPase, and Fis domain
LFGQERGSFVGRVATKPGWFERADGGTLFLDEIAELPLEAQVRLLRVLQEGTIERVGGTMALPVDVRIVAATHRDLREMVVRGAFREDLWHLISVFPIQLPPLRERQEDIPRLATHFAARAGMRLVGVPLTPTSEELELLLAYDWPGNVRELAAVIERAAILGSGRRLRLDAALGRTPTLNARTAQTDAQSTPATATLLTLEEAMRRHIELALQNAGGRVEGRRGAAVQLGINPHTLRARMRKLNVSSGKFRGSTARADEQSAALGRLDVAMADHISQALQLTSGRIEGQRGAARRLAINPHTLRARMRKLGIVAAAYRTGVRDN